MMDRGEAVDEFRLASLMLILQDEYGCHNINFVSPTHNVLIIMRAILIAAKVRGVLYHRQVEMGWKMQAH